VEERTEAIEFIVKGSLVPKPRMTQRDKWAKRPIVERWFVYKDLVAMSYRRAGGGMFVRPVGIEYDFFILSRKKMDLDNLVKGINDALNGLAWLDDNIKWVRSLNAMIHFVNPEEQELARIKITPLNSGSNK